MVTDCAACHNTTSPHHQNTAADEGDCQSCHGDLVDNIDDGHYIPTYDPSLVTPKRSDGDGLQLNSRGNGSGGCNYCHDNDGLSTPIILTNQELHHEIELVGFGSKCGWCHLNFDDPATKEQTRTCENCHGPDSLHNIQADSNGDGLVVIGGEDAGYGHVGRDAGPNDSDCWGCHGDYPITTADATPSLELTTPYLSDSTENSIIAGKDKVVILSGSSLTNTSGITKFESIFTLIAQDGSFKVLAPFYLTASKGFITIPGTTTAGNYKLRANKFSGTTWVKSNPLSISIKNPAVIWDQFVEQSCGECSGELTVWGLGFGAEQPEGSEEFMNVMQNGEKLNITYWKEPLIKATGAACDGSEITVNGLFGSATK